MTIESFLQNLANGISLGSLYALIAIGYTMVYGILRLINFAHGDLIMLGAYFAFYGISMFFLPLFLLLLFHKIYLLIIFLLHCLFLFFFVTLFTSFIVLFIFQSNPLFEKVFILLEESLIAGLLYEYNLLLKWITGIFVL